MIVKYISPKPFPWVIIVIYVSLTEYFLFKIDYVLSAKWPVSDVCGTSVRAAVHRKNIKQKKSID